MKIQHILFDGIHPTVKNARQSSLRGLSAAFLVKKYQNTRPSIKLCTDSFSKTDMDKLINMLSSKFNVKSYIGDRNRITFSTEETEKFLKIVRPYAHSDLLYKFFEDSYVEKMIKRQKS